jgi:hypothetical protein
MNSCVVQFQSQRQLTASHRLLTPASEMTCLHIPDTNPSTAVIGASMLRACGPYPMPNIE